MRTEARAVLTRNTASLEAVKASQVQGRTRDRVVGLAVAQSRISILT